LSKAAALRFEPRKTPRQARSTSSVGAILQATIQVLLKDGKSKLKATRIAERAGVSVGICNSTFRTESPAAGAPQGTDQALEIACMVEIGN
jgi:hypothetical protein